MRVHDTPLAGVKVVEHRVFHDERGYFEETFHHARFAEHGLPTAFVQDNHSRSRRGVLRGLHWQRRVPQGKLVMPIRGTIFDVAADVRPDSPTFGQWYGLTLSDRAPRSLWIPPGYAHGFLVLSDEADVVYKCTAHYAADDDHGVRWNDLTLAIAWPLDGGTPIVSAKDAALAGLDPARADLPRLGE